MSQTTERPSKLVPIPAHPMDAPDDRFDNCVGHDLVAGLVQLLVPTCTAATTSGVKGLQNQ
ncbi:hypothetical protein TRM7615_01569 [Falsiruegeria mediterranea M17]|uniref:Uncharacterized protein n=1 Tax=Falsiruegeria mediterranea M17 TaxID=1200281 RepID=A0A2R8C6K9_9RHOB|nr:hypothetical protein TRM7615_01569 [Falsiruegeria mediterranea M17]